MAGGNLLLEVAPLLLLAVVFLLLGVEFALRLRDARPRLALDLVHRPLRLFDFGLQLGHLLSVGVVGEEVHGGDGRFLRDALLLEGELIGLEVAARHEPLAGQPRRPVEGFGGAFDLLLRECNLALRVLKRLRVFPVAVFLHVEAGEHEAQVRFGDVGFAVDFGYGEFFAGLGEGGLAVAHHDLLVGERLLVFAGIEFDQQLAVGDDLPLVDYPDDSVAALGLALDDGGVAAADGAGRSYENLKRAARHGVERLFLGTGATPHGQLQSKRANDGDSRHRERQANFRPLPHDPIASLACSSRPAQRPWGDAWRSRCSQAARMSLR